MQITEKLCRRIIDSEYLGTLAGDANDRLEFTNTARCWIGDFAKEWIKLTARIAELEAHNAQLSALASERQWSLTP